jgi:hypothetical protein
MAETPVLGGRGRRVVRLLGGRDPMLPHAGGRGKPDRRAIAAGIHRTRRLNPGGWRGSIGPSAASFLATSIASLEEPIMPIETGVSWSLLAGPLPGPSMTSPRRRER